MKYLESILSLFRSLKGKSTSGKEDRLWDDWLKLKKREPRDLKELLNSDVRDEFKARALIILLAPDLQMLPFRWGHTPTSQRHYLFLDWINVSSLNQNLLNFVAELVCQNMDYAISSTNTYVRTAHFKYQEFILPLLSALSEESDLASQLFTRYQINDPIAYSNMDDASGYNPLRQILIAEHLPLKWKLLADQQMRERVIAEYEGREQPRENWEDALWCYANHIQMAHHEGRVRYACELFISQISFIVQLPNIEHYHKKLFNDWQVSHILDALVGDDHYETRHKFARLVVLWNPEKSSAFSVHNDETRRAAETILLEFGTEDLELFERLTNLIATDNKRSVSNQKIQDENSKKTEELLSRMR